MRTRGFPHGSTSRPGLGLLGAAGDGSEDRRCAAHDDAGLAFPDVKNLVGRAGVDIDAVTLIDQIGLTAEEAGADALSLINTLIGMAIDLKTRTPILGNITGGLSGPAIKPIGLRMVWQVAQAVRVPVVGVGGIASAEDALEYLVAGASAVQVGTAHFVDPKAGLKIIEGIERYLASQKLPNLQPLIGSLRARVESPPC